jgi:phage shock protein C
MSDQKRLYRSQTNRVIAGVCGGVAEYFDVDPTLVRIIWILFTIFGGWGILLYIGCLFVVPVNPTQPTPAQVPAVGNDHTLTRFLGITLIVVGLVFLLGNLDLFSVRSFFRFTWMYALPVLLIALGFYLVVFRKPSTQEAAPSAEPSAQTGEPAAGRRRMERSVSNRKLFGVCGGLGDYFDIDPTIVRLLFLVFTLMSFGFGILLYIILIFSMPEQRAATTASREATS